MSIYKTKVQIIYEILKDSIVSGDYKPGDRIIISQVAKDNEVSEIPVRESIRILESEGLVDIKPNIGPTVSVINEEDVKNQFEIRSVLEGYATRLSMDNISESDLLALAKIAGNMSEAIENLDYHEYSQLNYSFHMFIYERCGNPKLYNMIVELWNRWERNRSVFNLVPGRAKESLEEHYKIINLMKNKNREEIEKFVRHHKMQSALRLVEYIEQQK